MSRIDILIERAKKRAAAEKQQVGNAQTTGAQVEYLIRGGLLVRCAACDAVVEPALAYSFRGDKLCEDCYTIASHADFQDTAPGFSPCVEPAWQCQNCIGMAEHGCYCSAVGAVAPGGPLP